MTGRWGSISDGDATQIRLAAEDLRDLWAAFHMAQEMGKGLGRGALLLGPVPGRKRQGRQGGQAPCGLTFRIGKEY